MTRSKKSTLHEGTRVLAERMKLDPETGELLDSRTGPARRSNLGLGARYGAIARQVGALDSEARFAWLLGFAQMPMEELDHAASGEVVEHLMVFAMLQGVIGMPIRNARAELDIATIRTLRVGLETGLRSLTREDGEWAPSAQGTQRRFTRGADGSIVTEFEALKFVDALLWSIGDLLRDHGERLTACARQECARLFLRHKRGAYCSTRCSQKVRTDKMRAKLTPATRQQRNRQQRERYQAERQTELGPAVKVRRRTS